MAQGAALAAQSQIALAAQEVGEQQIAPVPKHVFDKVLKEEGTGQRRERCRSIAELKRMCVRVPVAYSRKLRAACCVTSSICWDIELMLLQSVCMWRAT